jgi:hypothetical protein
MATLQKTRLDFLSACALALLAMWAVGCGGSSPTEPRNGSGTVTMTVTSGTTVQAGSLLVRANTCDCSGSDLKVTIDAAGSFSVPCAGNATFFPLSAGRHTVVISSPTMSVPVTGDLTGTDGAGLVVDLRCQNR